MDALVTKLLCEGPTVAAVKEQRFPGLASPIAYLVTFEDNSDALMVEANGDDDTVGCRVVSSDYDAAGMVFSEAVSAVLQGRTFRSASSITNTQGYIDAVEFCADTSPVLNEVFVVRFEVAASMVHVATAAFSGITLRR